MKHLVCGLLFLFTAFNQIAYGGDAFAVMRLSSPLIASGSVGYRLGTPSPHNLRPPLQVEAGIGGGKLLMGIDNTGDASWGYGLKASLLRTWFEPIDVDRDQSFLGLHAELSIQRLVASIGGYRRISDGDDNWLGSVGLGFLF